MKIRYTILVLSVALSFINAQVDLEINNGMTVETTGGLSVELSGNLIENGTGYLKGNVESGARSGVTNFAGLNFSSGFTGTINRVTGTSYNKGNGEGTNCLRNYELNNTGSAITPNITSAIVASGTNDESNTMNGPYFLYTYDTDWEGNGDGSIGSTVSANSVSIGTGITDLVISEGTGVAAKIYLEGPYNGTNMNTSLNADVPMTSPYTDDPRSAATKPASAVDWVLVQLRETNNGPIVESRASFISADGFLIEDDGTQGIGVKAKPGDYFIVIKHRNHLGIMTNLVQTGLTWGG
ncbi:MAG: hypothetical protein GY936_19260 [Ignavibacteriae bacterium]|nr:hypothetical protein [Ignavibacteriota bacterium]